MLYSSRIYKNHTQTGVQKSQTRHTRAAPTMLGDTKSAGTLTHCALFSIATHSQQSSKYGMLFYLSANSNKAVTSHPLPRSQHFGLDKQRIQGLMLLLFFFFQMCPKAMTTIGLGRLSYASYCDGCSMGNAKSTQGAAKGKNVNEG